MSNHEVGRMSKIHIIDPLKCTRCRYHMTLGDWQILAHACWYPVTVASFGCSNRQVVSA